MKAVQDNNGVCTIPMFAFGWEQTAIPSVWPMEGTANALKEHYYAPGGAHMFPPPGFMLEVTCPGTVPKVSLRPL